MKIANIAIVAALGLSTVAIAQTAPQEVPGNNTATSGDVTTTDPTTAPTTTPDTTTAPDASTTTAPDASTSTAPSTDSSTTAE